MSKAKNQDSCIRGLWAVYQALLGWRLGAESIPDETIRSRKAPDSHRDIVDGGVVVIEHTRFPIVACQGAVEAQFAQVRLTLPDAVADAGFIRAFVQLNGKSLPRDLPRDLAEHVLSDHWPPDFGVDSYALPRTGLRLTVERRESRRDKVVWRPSGDVDDQPTRLRAVLDEAREKFGVYPDARRVLLIESDDYEHISPDTFPDLLTKVGADPTDGLDDVWYVDTSVSDELHYRVLATADKTLSNVSYVAWAPATGMVEVHTRT